MEAYRPLAAGSPDDTIPTWQDVRFDSSTVREAESCTRLVAAAERPTLPPPAVDGADDVMVSRIHLGPSVDEVLYRLSLGDLLGAALANEELEHCIPSRCAPPVLVATMQLSYLEEFVLASIDGQATWGEVLDSSPFNPRDTLKALCELVDKGALALSV